MMLIDTLESDEKAKSFRTKRLDKIKNGQVWGPLSEGPYCVLHWLPISEKVLFGTDDFKSMKLSDIFSEFIRAREGNITERLNLHGIGVRSNEKDEIQGSHSFIEGDQERYFWNAQLFRSGALEVAFAMSFGDKSAEMKWIYPRSLIEDLWIIMNGLNQYISLCNKAASIIVGVSILYVRGYKFITRKGSLEPYAHLDGEDIILPGKRIENLQKVESVEEIEHPIFDMLWQSFGKPDCDYYDSDGKRVMKD